MTGERKLSASVDVLRRAHLVRGARAEDLVGRTPLLSLERIGQDLPGVRLFAKAEWFNPGGSVKDRAAASIIADAEASGRLAAALQVAQQADASSDTPRTIVMVFPDAGARYAAEGLFSPRNGRLRAS